MQWSIRFLGVGGAVASTLGSAACVVEYRQQPQLLIDCGPGTIGRYREQYGALPGAVFITHLHLDHIGDLEALFYQACFSEPRHPVKLYVSYKLVPLLHERIANYPGTVAEGGINFWDVIQLVPASEGFWLDKHWFDIYSVRHHRPETAFALHLNGRFFYSGDTRPIPEILHHYCNRGEIIFHDGCVNGNPSHSGIDDIVREYRQDVLERMVIYHYSHANDCRLIEQRGLNVARCNDVFGLTEHISAHCSTAPLRAIGE